MELDGSDELHAEAKGVVERMAATMSQQSRRNRFLANFSSIVPASITKHAVAAES